MNYLSVLQKSPQSSVQRDWQFLGRSCPSHSISTCAKPRSQAVAFFLYFLPGTAWICPFTRLGGLTVSPPSMFHRCSLDFSMRIEDQRGRGMQKGMRFLSVGVTGRSFNCQTWTAVRMTHMARARRYLTQLPAPLVYHQFLRLLR